MASSVRHEKSAGMTRATEAATTQSPITSDDIEPVSVATGRSRRRLWIWLGTIVAFVGLVVAALLVPTPYYAFAPGSVTPTEAHIEVKGARTYRSKGDINFLTVSIQRATVATWLQSRFDHYIELVSRHDAFPSGNAKKEQAVNQRAMDDSKVVASVVALEEVGYTVKRSGDGAFIESVGKDTPASAVHLVRGDVITAVDGQPITIVDELTGALRQRAVGQQVALTVRDQKEKVRTVEVTLGERPDQAGSPYLGVALTTSNEKVDLPVDVEIDSGRVTGPSAGLAFTLGVIDRLTPGDLAGGRQVAVTGTIDPSGAVGPIGGIAQKTRAAIDAGASLLLYPAGTAKAEVKEVKAIAKGHMDVRPVATIDDALAVLAPKGVAQVGAGR